MPLIWDERADRFVYIAFEEGGLLDPPPDVWRLEGYDTFEGAAYPLDGVYFTEAAAVRAARDRLAELEASQPSASSGGQAGIQDQVSVVRPDASRFRVTPGTTKPDREDRMAGFFRRLGRGIGRVLWWPFRALGHLLRGIGHVIGEVVEFVVDLVFPS